MSKLMLNKHYEVAKGGYIKRKLFLCRTCDKPCSPCDYEVLPSNQTYKIARSYYCKPCSSKFSLGSFGVEEYE